MRQTTVSKVKRAKSNIATSILQQHITRPRFVRAANDNKSPASHIIKGTLFWAAIIALTGFMLHAQFTA